MEEKNHSIKSDNMADKALEKETAHPEKKALEKETAHPEQKALEKETAHTEKKKQIKIDYKSPASLYQFISEGGKINPARITGLRHAEQRQLRNAVKKARRLSLIPSSARAYDDFGWPEPISPVPFEL